MTMITNDDILLQARNITKVYTGTTALKGVDFNIYRGKVNVLIGENGAGKSTLMKILAGVERASSGQLLMNGKEIHINSPRDANHHGIGIIYQELNLYPNLSVAENIFMSHQLTRFGMVRDKDQQAIAADLMRRLEQSIEPTTIVSELRIGQQQIIEIAKALAQNVQILIMDEPTSALSNTEVEVLFRIIAELKTQDVAIVYISHKLDELLEIGDHFTILRDGQLVAEAPKQDVNLNWIVHSMVGREADSLFKHSDHAIQQEVLSVEDLTLPRMDGGFVVDHVSFRLHAGEVVGIYGLMGAGRTELLESLMGLNPDAQGQIFLNGKNLHGLDIKSRIQLGLSLVPEDRQLRGLVQKLSVAHNVTLASLSHYMRFVSLSAHKERESVDQEVRDLRIKVANCDNLITSLSGGNQQKVVVGKSLLTHPKVLMLDEPTRGIDVAAKGEIFEIINQLALEGLGVLFVSSELKEILAMADRVLVMWKGRITAEFQKHEISQENIAAASVGAFSKKSSLKAQEAKQ